ncbi:MAG TPA: hypothetical protein VLD67_11735 [Vicinamibacterales bacterium]|nr:hypothetical protein [Vicinamibacterales bacterium]
MNDYERLNRERANALMMAVLDDECTAEERKELDALVAARPEIAAEWARLKRVREVTATMGLRKPPEEIWDRYRVSVLHRAERSIGWLLVTLGGAVLMGWALWRWIEALVADGDTPLAIKGAILAVVVGLILLLLSVARERWFLHRRDPYSREVTR